MDEKWVRERECEKEAPRHWGWNSQVVKCLDHVSLHSVKTSGWGECCTTQMLSFKETDSAIHNSLPFQTTYMQYNIASQ